MLTWKKRPPKSDPSSKPREHTTQGGWDLIYVARMIHELTTIHADQKAAERRMASELDRIPPEHRKSALNLLHYLSLRARDVRSLQEALASIGLSSLGRAESHVMHNVLLLLKHLHHMLRHSWEVPPGSEHAVTLHEGRSFLDRRAARLLGSKPSSRATRIMVTMPAEAAKDYELVRDLVASGMNSMRINCAHDGPEIWEGMIAHLRRAERELGMRCSLLMDLGGPKIRTGPVEPGPKVIKWKPVRDDLGRTKVPAQIWLTSIEEPRPAPESAAAVLPVRRSWLREVKAGDRLHFRDTRDNARELEVIGVQDSGCWTVCRDTCYVAPSTPLVRIDADGRKFDPEPIGDLPALERTLTLKQGDHLLLTRSPDPGRPAPSDDGGRGTSPARISCTLPEAIVDVRPGEPVRFDDGKIDGRVVETTPEGLLIEIIRAAPKGSKLGVDKGINFPASTLSIPSLTERDLQDLKFIVRHANMVGYSFVRTPEDVRELRRQIEQLGAGSPGLILKIETRAAFAHLPALLMAALEAPTAGIMIARGDLAIECGYERLAELQEEILWLCEAAHLPVIWATQVLEHLAKDGQPSRAEVTDAAMGERAECIMLNKGPHVVEAVKCLDDIIRRMEAHQSKKMPMFRILRVAVDALSAIEGS
jgi:pyruvate kinase